MQGYLGWCYDELKEASEQGGAACMVGAEWVGDTGLGAQKGFGGSRVFSGFLWSLMPRRLGSEWGAGRETRVEAFAMKPALDGVGRGSKAAHVRRDCRGPSGRVCCWLDGASEGGVHAAGRV